MKKRPGRPPGSTKPDAKRVVLRIRCHDIAEKGRWLRHSRKAGLTLSEWCRTALNAAARKEH